MGVDVSTEVLIRRPKAEVAAFSADIDNTPLWYKNIKQVEWKTERPLAVGSQIAFVAQFLGRRLAYTYEVVAFDPGERLILRTPEGPFPMETSYHWATAAGEGTRMTIRNRGLPRGFSRLIAPLMARAVRRANRKDLALLKEILEAPD